MPFSWWKVKLTGTTHDTEKQIGLVPAAYVEQVGPVSIIRRGLFTPC